VHHFYRVPIVLLGLLASTAVAEPMTQSGMPGVGGTLAIPEVPVDGSWVVLEEVMQEGQFYSPIYRYTTNLPQVQIDVTDLYVVSDQNEVWLGLPPADVLIGATPAVPDWPDLQPPVGPFDTPWTDDPDIAWATPEFSKSSFILPGAGTYYFRMRNIHIPPSEDGPPMDTGTVAFRLVPEPGTLPLMALLALLVGGARQRGRFDLWHRLRKWRPQLREHSSLALRVVVIGTLIAPALPAGAQSLQGVQGSSSPGFGNGGAACPTISVCTNVTAGVSGSTLEIQLQAPLLLRLRLVGDCIEIFVVDPINPCATFDAVAEGIDSISIVGSSGDDQIIIDDEFDVVADRFNMSFDGGAGTDIIIGGVTDYDAALLAELIAFRNALQANDYPQLTDDLIQAAANELQQLTPNIIEPAVDCVRSVRDDLIPTTESVIRETVEQEVTTWADFVVTDAEALHAEAETLEANIDDSLIDPHVLLVDAALNLEIQGRLLYDHAVQVGLQSQSKDPEVIKNTMLNYAATLEFWAEECEPVDPDETGCPDPGNPMCDPDAGDEDAQVPSGLPSPCEQLEILAEQLEGLVDSIETEVDGVEAEGDALEMMADEESGGAGSLEGMGNDLATEAEAIELDIEDMETSSAAFEEDAEQRAADQEDWAAAKGDQLEAEGLTLEQCGGDVEASAADAETSAIDNLRTPALAIEPALNDLLLNHPRVLELMADNSASPRLQTAVTRCDVMTVHTVNGGPGTDILIGTPANDLLKGGDGVDLIIGGAGDDRLEGEGDTDFLFGGGGTNELFGGDEFDLLVGGNDVDCIFGEDGIDLALGRDGNDNIHGGEKIDILIGGAADDLIFGDEGQTVEIASLSIGLGNLFFGDGIGSTGDDTIIGGSDNPGDPNNPVLLTGIDFVFAGPGNDTVDIGDGGDFDTDPSSAPFPLTFGGLVLGSAGDDEITAGTGIDFIFGGTDDDEIVAGEGFVFIIDSDDDNNAEFSLPLGDFLFGQDGDDTVHGDDPDGNRDDDDIDFIFGGMGDDPELNGHDGGLIEFDTDDDGTNEFELFFGNLIFGSQGDDGILAGKGLDLLFGGDDNDTIEAGYGVRLQFGSAVTLDFGDLIFGSAGDDTIHGDQPEARANPDPDDGEVDGIDLIFAGEGDDTVYSGDGGLFVVGDINTPTSIDVALTFGNLIFGGPGNDALRAKYELPSAPGEDDDDRPGLDLIFGGAGNDDDIIGGDGTLIFIGPVASPTLIPFGNLLFGSTGDDVIRGADDAPIPDVGLPVNPNGILDIFDAMDLIFAGAGDDDVESYNGIDLVFGSDGEDRLVATNGGVMLFGGAVPIPFGNLIFGGDDDDVIESDGRVLLLEIDLLFGGKCDDTIEAGGGLINLVFGGKHHDDINAAGDPATINLLFGNRGMDEITTSGIGINLIFGNRDDDDINAGDGINVLFGNRGDDIVTGGSGINLLFGNRGDDTVGSGGDDGGIYLLFGNRGSDIVQGGPGINLAFGNRCNDEVYGGPGLSLLFGNRGDDIVAGGAGVTLAFGNRDDDRISSGPGLALLFGNSGDDRLLSGGGLDLGFGNSGNDILCSAGGGLTLSFGNSGEDIIFGGNDVNLLFGNRDDDWISGDNGGLDLIFGNSGNDTIFGRGGDVDLLFGNRDNDEIDGEAGFDLILGNRGNDRLLSGDGSTDILLGNRGNDFVYSDDDNDNRDLLLGNRGNDDMDGDPPGGILGCRDIRIGGRGNDDRSCDGLGLTFAEPSPRFGIVRGIVEIDLDNDNNGDVGHGGVQVTITGPSGVLNTTTASDSGGDCPSDEGTFSFTGLLPGNYTVCQTVPADFEQVDPASGTCRNITILDDCGGSIVTGVSFANRENCAPRFDGLACAAGNCMECQPTRVRRVMRCAQTGDICDSDADCECNVDCVPGWEVIACECDPECYIDFDPVEGPLGCLGGCPDGTACHLVEDGDEFYCDCQPSGCEVDYSMFTFRGRVGFTSIPGGPIAIGDPWELRFWFLRNASDVDPNPASGDYGVSYYETWINGTLYEAHYVEGSPDDRILVFDGIVGQDDQYRVVLPVFDAIPGHGSYLRLNGFWDAFMDDSLPLCATFNFPLFEFCIEKPCGEVPGFEEECRCFEYVGPQRTGTVYGFVDEFECDDCSAPPL
jgi:Ca2+-binding RTX toxin-like protein